MRRCCWVCWMLVIGGLTLMLGVLSCADKETPTRSGGEEEVTFTKVSGDNQTCLAMDTLPNRMVVELKQGDSQPLANVYLTFTLSDGRGQVAVKPTGEAGVTAVRVPTDGAGIARIQFQAFESCRSVVRGVVDTIPGLSVEFTINPGPACQ